MRILDARTVPADPDSVSRLAESGFEYRVIDADNPEAFTAQSQAISRGFLGKEMTSEHIEAHLPTMRERRLLGAFDPSSVQAELPIGTIESWVTPLTVPGGELAMWAISGVTVAGTHRRRGIARNMLEGELRAAASAGLALAGLTVSEATIYGRYGFASAIPVANYTLDARRTSWGGPTAPGRLHYVTREQATDDMELLHERVRAHQAGEIAGWRRRWQQAAGTAAAAKDQERFRAVRYVDAEGETRGILSYTLDDAPDGFAANLNVSHLLAENSEAEAALWRFVVEHDLLHEARADRQAVDSPLPWLLTNQRALSTRLHDHGWIRILDVPRVLEARSYASKAAFGLRVRDELGFAEGTWRVEITNGSATVSEVSDPGSAVVELDVATLAAAYLGGTTIDVLARAGRVSGASEAVSAMDAAFRTRRAPLLSIWY